jgi:Protein of unknown function (DUF3570)
LQLNRPGDARYVVAAALLGLGLLSSGVLEAAPKPKTKKATAAAPTNKPNPKRRKKPAKVEKVVLEEDEQPASRGPADAKTPAPDPTDGERVKESPDAERPASSKPEAGGVTPRVSLETTAYKDSDGVSVLSPTVAGSTADEVSGWSVGGSYLVDVVTAASVDIVSTASPSWTEVRHVGALNGSKKWDLVTAGAVAVVSREPDYLAITGGASLSIDLLEKNVTPYVAVSFEKDSIGRTGLPHEYWKSKQVTNLQAGVTLVLGRATIGSVQWDGSFERGYLAKPYRYVPLFAPGQAASIRVGAPIDEVNQLRLGLRAIEQLPGSRDRHAVSGHLAHRFERATLRLDERLYADDWKLMASTTELRYLVDVGTRFLLWPHARYHVQGSVNFWKRAYEAVPGPGGLVAPTLRTGDRELGPLQTIVLGAGIRWTLADSPGNRWDLMLEADVGRTTFSDTLYITERYMGYSTLACEAVF